ncbi:hypothetical protein E2562_014697 [Oryza meyeriana var. granulata]|uniref:Uncharacterized protein n=1 Tax=Oryza meyeriana var. granulata TaxID=110450 RepID=A0A6G1D3W7_9ORYZ|nr:hypothetical protein E2562_014697 [Oryza meyeriana var. granulata]
MASWFVDVSPAVVGGAGSCSPIRASCSRSAAASPGTSGFAAPAATMAVNSRLMVVNCSTSAAPAPEDDSDRWLAVSHEGCLSGGGEGDGSGSEDGGHGCGVFVGVGAVWKQRRGRD